MYKISLGLASVVTETWIARTEIYFPEYKKPVRINLKGSIRE
jgi:hypothetical protein